MTEEMMARERIAAAALALVGVRFRLHGRDPAQGLDCIGLVARSLAEAGWSEPVPTGYGLRGDRAAEVAAWFDARGRRVAEGEPGDVLLAVTGPAQLHLAIQTAAGLVHADAGLRRVVERPGPPPWPLIGLWRMGED